MNTGCAVNSLKCIYAYGGARKSAFQRFLLALIGTLERHRPALFACAYRPLGEDQEPNSTSSHRADRPVSRCRIAFHIDDGLGEAFTRCVAVDL